MDIRIAGAANDSIVDGPGIRLTIFTQGCTHECKGCQNPETHDPQGGYDISVERLIGNIEKNKLLDGVTFSGGEPFLQPEPLIQIAQWCHEHGLNVWAYSGFLYEQLLEDKPNTAAHELLNNVDVLVDGPFIEAQRSLELHWKGSANQRVIDVAASRMAGAVVLAEE